MFDIKLGKLEKWLKAYKKVIVAFSGGVDSSFVLYFSEKYLGKENVIAVTGISETYTKDERRTAEKFVKELGVELILVETGEFQNPDFYNNPKERCYYCKKELYSSVSKIAEKKNITTIIDGTTLSDISDYRPGKKAAQEFSVKSPLLEIGFDKDEIREILKYYNLKFWDKPANPCLASRIPYNNKITENKLEQIEKGENFLKLLGFKIVRVRHHDELAKIEVPEKDITRILDADIKQKITDYFKKIGFVWIAVDLTGYRTGSLNESHLK
jgi:pyridinium-3,5-biscarboxylic acid mononucleotide sulfurtransferase